MLNIRAYFSLVCLTKNDKGTSSCIMNPPSCESLSSPCQCCNDFFYRNSVKSHYFYAIGGKHGSIGLKTIEKYDVQTDSWKEIRMQLNYDRAFASSICMGERYIYVLGGTTNTDCIEIIDTHKENQNIKSELVLLHLENYVPWFKEILLPLDEEGIITFCGEGL